MNNIIERIDCNDGTLALVIERVEDGISIGFDGYEWRMKYLADHNDKEAFKEAEAAAKSIIKKIVSNKAVIAIKRINGAIDDVWISDDPEEESRYKQIGQEIQLRYWSDSYSSNINAPSRRYLHLFSKSPVLLTVELSLILGVLVCLINSIYSPLVIMPCITIVPAIQCVNYFHIGVPILLSIILSGQYMHNKISRYIHYISCAVFILFWTYLVVMGIDRAGHAYWEMAI